VDVRFRSFGHGACPNEDPHRIDAATERATKEICAAASSRAQCCGDIDAGSVRGDHACRAECNRYRNNRSCRAECNGYRNNRPERCALAGGDTNSRAYGGNGSNLDSRCDLDAESASVAQCQAASHSDCRTYAHDGADLVAGSGRQRTRRDGNSGSSHFTYAAQSPSIVVHSDANDSAAAAEWARPSTNGTADLEHAADGDNAFRRERSARAAAPHFDTGSAWSRAARFAFANRCA
jgi:hypothetical protein